MNAQESIHLFDTGVRTIIKYVLSTCLAPVLVAQGLWTRARVTQLPEPPGARSGTAGSGAPLGLLVTGDSAAAGVGTANQADALAGQLTGRLQDRFQIRWSLEAKTGATTRSTIEHLSGLPSEGYNVAVTSLGVNDVTSHRSLGAWLEEQAQLRGILRARFGVSMIITSGLPPMHGFPALPQPLRWHLGWRASLFDSALREALEDEPDAIFMNLRFTENVDAMAEDGFHPGPTVYAEWARRVSAVIIEHFGA